MDIREAHVEQLLGCRVRDERGRVIGRIEEMIVEVVDDEYVVTEFHLGTAALVERITGFVRQLPFFNFIPGAKRPIRVGWKEMDLSDPSKPIVHRLD